MDFVRVEVWRWVDREWPGWIEVRLREADGGVALIVDKVPVLIGDDEFGGDLPVWVEIPCEVAEWVVGAGGERVAIVRLGFGLTDADGRASFRIGEADVISRA